MKNLLYFLFVSMVLSACTFTSKTHEETSEKEPAKTILKASMLDDTKDYSCGMTMQDGGIADTTLYNGKVYGFCATGCKEAFLKDPEALLKK
jgi:YHS domain-containing protein